MFLRISKKRAKEMMETGLVCHDCKPYNVVRNGVGRWGYTKVEPQFDWPKLADWDSTTFEYIYFLCIEE